jgi:ribosomal protein S18 acetylase RimI-like enzyme
MPTDRGEATDTGPVSLRDARPEDAEFLTAMLLEAANWNPDRRAFTIDELPANPALIHYVAGWPRPGDDGIVAIGEHNEPVGAAWLRRFRADDPGYGFVDEDTPELSVGVAPQYRGRGIGRALCTAVLDQARDMGVRQVSLSVEKANRAITLYGGLGFVEYADHGDAVTMLRRL